jgi:hypothetical protein
LRVSRGERVCVVATLASIRHTLDAPALEYVPAMHAAQKSGDDAQRVLKDVPAGQSVQTEAPAVSAYLPASQGRQASKEVARGVGEYVPVLQGVHVDVSPVPS